MAFTETQRQRRGHDFLPPPAELARMPKLYQTERSPRTATLDDKIIVVHYFTRGADWWLAEIDPEHDDGPLGWGYARLAAFPEGAEWGYVSLTELETLAIPAHPEIIVERDLHWQAVPFRVVREERIPRL